MQKVLITGAGNGIGREIVLAFARGGARVAGLDVDAGALQALGGDFASFVSEPCDLSDAAAIEASVPRAIAALGGLDVLVNNVGALRNQSLKYFTEASEVAALAVFLASDSARSISGQSFPIDGDMHRSV